MSRSHQHLLDDYLSLYFVPDVEVAGSYVRELVVPDTELAEDPIELLCRIIDERTAERGHPEIVIPLTGGLDSRGLLGAALQVVPATAIHCVTFGADTFPDVTVAAATCRRVGVTHERVDPNAIRWDLARLTGAGLATWHRWHSLGPIDALATFGALSDVVGDRLALSGYLGGVASGSHLPKVEERWNGPAAGPAFLNKEHAKATELVDIRHRVRLKTIFGEFLSRHHDLVDALPGLTSYDLLHLGFRQNGLIRSVASGAYRDCLTPYEDPRWVKHWMSGSLDDRLNGSRYRRLLHRSFPALFPEGMPPPATPPPGRAQRARVRLRARQGSTLPTPPPAERPAPLGGRGDVRRNPSMAAVLGEAVSAFDERRIIPDVSVSASFQNLMGARPTASSFMRVRTAASAEMYLRAGVLA